MVEAEGRAKAMYDSVETQRGVMAGGSRARRTQSAQLSMCEH